MRLRALAVVLVVLVLGAWTCAPSGGTSPGSGGGEVPISTTGLTALVGGEDWHYVGETDQPAFSTTWANVSGDVKMAFRIREAGVVDIQGTVAPGTSAGVFVLPEGYRPSAKVTIPVAYEDGGLVVGLMIVSTNGTVQMPGTSGSYYTVNGQFFLDPPDLAP